MKLSKRQRKEQKKSKWYRRGITFDYHFYRNNPSALEYMAKEIYIASKKGKFSLTVSNPTTKNEKELMGGYYKLIVDMGGKIKEPWTFQEVDYLKEKQLATITFELYERD